jgi:signal transduction histidine kinase
VPGGIDQAAWGVVGSLPAGRLSGGYQRPSDAFHHPGPIGASLIRCSLSVRRRRAVPIRRTRDHGSCHTTGRTVASEHAEGPHDEGKRLAEPQEGGLWADLTWDRCCTGGQPPPEDAVFDDLSIRNKLILLLAGPIVIIVLLAATGARSRLDSASDSRRVERQVALARASSDIVDALQHEGLASAAYVASGRKAHADEVKATRAATDKVLGERLDDIAGAPSSFSSSASLAVAAAKKLGYVRDAVDQGYRWDQVAVTYADTQDTFLAFAAAVTDTVTDAGAAAELRTAATLDAYKSYLARQGAIVSAAAEAGGLGTAGNEKLLREALAGEDVQSTLFKSVAGAGSKEAVRNALSSDAQLLFERVRDQAVEAGADGDLAAKGSTVAAAADTMIGDLHGVQVQLFDSELSSARSARSSAERAADVFLVGALLAIVGAIAAALFLGRRITGPLGRLTEAADRLSSEQMPKLIETLKNPIEEELGFQIGSLKPIEIDSGDEIGRLATAFNEVQRVAGTVANEQAQLLRKGIGEMFVNLARRNQALLDRQIEFIDELERGEEDPDQLENLYRLDHLATRMRRNAESLLVLAGAEPPRRRGRPAPLANVVRAALAEVEDFGRIELLSFDEVLVASNAAADLAHLLSELMENATNFSPPETKVEVVGHKTKADGYVISITDHGIGMSGDQIVEANESLAKPPLVGLAMSRSLGFIVVGRLAVRHGIAVRMMPTASGGATAVVSIPPSLVVDTPGGMADAAATRIDAPARLKPVLEGSATAPAPGPAGGPLEFAASGEEAAPAAAAADSGAAPLGLGGDRPRNLPAPAVFAPPADASPSAAPARPPASTGPTRRPVTSEPGQMPRRTPAASNPPAANPPAADPPARPEPAAAPAPGPEALPAAMSFTAPEDRSPLDTTVTPDFAPGPEELLGLSGPSAPRAPLPPSVAGQPEATPRPSQANRPFFLEDAEPPRPFGQARPEQDGPREAAPAPAPATPPRLFGGPAPSPAGAPNGNGLAARRPGATPAEPTSTGPAGSAAPSTPAARAPRTDTRPPAAPRLDSRPPAAPGAPGAPVRPAHAGPTPPSVMPPSAHVAATPPAAPAPGAPAAGDAAAAAAPAEVTTTSGLTKRVPRKAGATRAIPGSEVERGVGATRRSPEEVRRMLASHSAGRQRARTTEPVPAGASDEKESQ